MANRMSVDGLRYAQAVARTGSFSAAARAHGITQPALSNGIARLEGQLGERLFERSPRGASLTGFGTRILPFIDKVLDSLDALGAEAERWLTPGGDHIRMGVSPVIAPGLVARTYAAVRELPADVPRQLVLREANLAELQEALLAGELDIMVVPSVGPLPRYEHRVVDSEPLVLVEPGADTDSPAGLAELAVKQLILLPDTCGLTTFTHQLLSSHGLPLQAYPGEAATYKVLEEWPSLGLGAALLPLSKLSSPDSTYRLVRDGEGTVVEIFYEVVWDPASPLAPDLRTLTDRLMQRP